MFTKRISKRSLMLFLSPRVEPSANCMPTASALVAAWPSKPLAKEKVRTLSMVWRMASELANSNAVPGV
ncbi:hypothetical protein D3C80_2155410 [compost metagenome]